MHKLCEGGDLDRRLEVHQNCRYFQARLSDRGLEARHEIDVAGDEALISGYRSSIPRVL
jgi:hypothetical protein